MSEQGTQEWRDERSGHVTASRISDLMAKSRTKGKESASRNNYRAQLICERMNGRAIEEDFQSWDMKRGIELEPTARIEYEMKKGVDVETVGFILHPTIKLAGASPDGLIGKDGLVQFKCAKRGTHLQWLMSGIVPVEYRPQMYFEMACTGRQWCDFAAYHPEFPEHLQLFIVRLKRDAAEIEAIESEVKKFLAEVDEIIAKLPSKEGESALEHQLTKSLELSAKDIADVTA